MADVRALRGVRYNPQRQADIGRLIAPPYDTSEPATASDGAVRASFNIAELENIDLVTRGDSHALAAARYAAWQAQGLLIRDELPALYVHDHTYHDGDQLRHRRGLLARVRLADWAEGIVLPHERTFPGPRQERLERIRAVRANLSPLYLLYHDESGTLRDLLAAAVAATEPVAAGADASGGEHRLTRLDDPIVLARATERFAGERLFVADGHHRYEAALAYRDEQRRAGASDQALSEFVLAMLCDITDPGVQVRPTHRVVHGLPRLDLAWFRTQLDAVFEVESVAAADSVPRPGLICTIAPRGARGHWRIYRRAGDPHERLLPSARSPAWRELEVAIGDQVILETILKLDGVRMPRHVSYTHEAAAAQQMIDAGEAQLALLYASPSLLALSRVAAAGDTLPPKSTYFDPKPPAGLVINDLDGS